MNVVFDGNLGWLYVFFHRAYAIRPHAVMCMASYILPPRQGTDICRKLKKGKVFFMLFEFRVMQKT